MDAQIEELLLASLDDEVVLSLPVPDRIFGFHGQQVIEKLLKMLISAIANVTPSSTTSAHFVPQLRVWGSRPTPFKFTELTEFAGVFRYSTPREFTSTERDQIRETVRILREFVNTRLKTTQRLTPSKRDSAPNRACQPPTTLNSLNPKRIDLKKLGILVMCNHYCPVRS